MIGDREIDLEELCQATEGALGLAKRKMEDHADRQGSLDGDVSIDALSTGLAAGRCPPGIESVVGQPNGDITTTLEPDLILRPIPYPISRLRVLVLAVLRILQRCGLWVWDFASP